MFININSRRRCVDLHQEADDLFSQGLFDPYQEKLRGGSYGECAEILKKWANRATGRETARTELND